MFTIGEKDLGFSGVSDLVDIELTIGNNITLIGRNSNDSPLIKVCENSTFIMETGAKITGNTNTTINLNYGPNLGGGVFVSISTGSFIMSGGIIYGNNSAGAGGGVYAMGNFTMTGGIISGNTATGGGGIYGRSISSINQGIVNFTKTGGTIYGKNEGDNSNIATNGDTYGYTVFINHGGAKYRDITTGTMDNIDSNTAEGLTPRN